MQQEEKQTPLTHPAVKTAVTATIAVGSFAAHAITRTHNEFYDNCREFQEVKELFKQHGEKIDELRTQNVSGYSFIEGVRGHKQRLAAEIDTLSQKLGIESESALKKYTIGSWQRFRTLSNNTRLPIVFGAITAAFIGGAGSLMFFNSMQTRHKLDKIAGQKAESDIGRG